MEWVTSTKTTTTSEISDNEWLVDLEATETVSSQSLSEASWEEETWVSTHEKKPSFKCFTKHFAQPLPGLAS